MMDDVEDPLFDAYEEDFLAFDRVVSRLSNRPDLHAFLLLEQLVPAEKSRDIVSSAAHDEIWLDVDVEKLKAVATVDQLRDLHRCGVRYDAEQESLCMFV